VRCRAQGGIAAEKAKAEGREVDGERNSVGVGLRVRRGQWGCRYGHRGCMGAWVCGCVGEWVCQRLTVVAAGTGTGGLQRQSRGRRQVGTVRVSDPEPTSGSRWPAAGSRWRAAVKTWVVDWPEGTSPYRWSRLCETLERFSTSADATRDWRQRGMLRRSPWMGHSVREMSIAGPPHPTPRPAGPAPAPPRRRVPACPSKGRQGGE
jgi:hypothetical protein